MDNSIPAPIAAQPNRQFQHRNTKPARPGPVSIDAHAELLASLTRINLYTPPVQTCSTGWTFHGLRAGPTSIAYLFYRLSTIYAEDFLFKNQSLLDWAQAYLLSTPRPRVDADHCGVANETLAQLTLRACIEGDTSLARQLCSYASVLTRDEKEGSNEWLYGRAGYLYFLRLARSSFTQDQHPSTFAVIQSAIQKVVKCILSVPQPWTSQGREYLGAAHGTIGIITQIVLSSSSHSSHLEAILAELLSTQLPSGNFPTLPSSDSDQVVQFGDGAPGLMLALRSIQPHLSNRDLQEATRKAIDAARVDVCMSGRLTKSPCLCHEIAGNAFVLDDPEHFDAFLRAMSSDELESKDCLRASTQRDSPVGLVSGEVGRAWVWAVADQQWERTWIGFNDL